MFACVLSQLFQQRWREAAATIVGTHNNSTTKKKKKKEKKNVKILNFKIILDNTYDKIT